MSSRCDEIREQLPAMVVGALGSREQEEIADHLSHCPTCADYERALGHDDGRLKALADSLQSSVARIEQGVAAALERGSVKEPVARAEFWRWIVRRRMRKFAAATVVVVALVLGVSYLTRLFNETAPAFADVLEKIQESRSVSYRQSYDVEGSEPFATDVMATEPGLLRTVLPHGDIAIQDFNSGKSLHLMPHAKKALLTQRVGAPERKRLFNYLDWIQSLHKGSGEFVRKEEMDGRDVNVFAVERDPYYTITVWTDAATDLPVRVEHVLVPNPNTDITVPEISLSLADFGGTPGFSRTISQSGSGGIHEKAIIVKNNFRWNVVLDASLFRLTPPEGYTLEESELDVSSNGETDLVEALSLWVEMSDSRFPERINDLCDNDKVRPMLTAKYDRDGTPEEELEEAMAAANILVGGLFFAQQQKADGTWRYAGAGVRFGDAKTPVCWWQPEDSKKYRVIYGDLRIADVDAADLPAQESRSD